MSTLQDVLDDERKALGKTGEQEPLTGLALSGGGVRSAAFNLGLLQALRDDTPGPNSLDPNPLDRIDYLSAVSGGSYAAAHAMQQGYFAPTPPAAQTGATAAADDPTRRLVLSGLYLNRPLAFLHHWLVGVVCTAGVAVLGLLALLAALAWYWRWLDHPEAMLY